MKLIYIMNSSLTMRNDYSEEPLFEDCVWFVVDSLQMDIAVAVLNFSDVGLLAVVVKVYTSLRRKIFKSRFFL